jgi:FkbM family methyltransferase
MNAKTVLKPWWRSYVEFCTRHPGLAPPMPNTLRTVGRVWAHPFFCRTDWTTDQDGVYRTLAGLMEDGDVLFDVGANVGVTSLIGSRRVGRSGRVAAFEPSAKNLQMLRYHLRWNRARNVTVEPFCVGASDGEVTFSLQEETFSASNSMTFPRMAQPPFLLGKSRNVTVPMVSLDSYARRTGLTPHVIKIDVEGAELEVLCGAAGLLDESQPVLLLAVHPFWWPDGQAKTALAEFLAAHRYRVENLQGEEAPPDAYADFVCRPHGIQP